MAYHAAREVVVLFGGADIQANLYRDTWEYDGTGWTAGATGPMAPRAGHTMHWDAARRVVVVFGGLDAAQNFADVWEYDGAWSAGQGPPAGLDARDGHGVAWDARRGRAVFFGGTSNTTLAYDDTWEYDGASWFPGPAAPSGLEPRAFHSMGWDAGRARVVLFGGTDGFTAPYGDTWEYDGTSWSPGGPAGPAARSAHAMAGGPTASRVVLFGGVDVNRFRDTWEYGPGGWGPGVAAPAGLTARAGHAMAYDLRRGAAVVFGGSGLSYLNDTWEYRVCLATISVGPATLIDAIEGVAYSQQLSATGAAGPFSFSVSGGALPPGLSLSPSGLISGVPTASGAFTFRVDATEPGGCLGSRTYTLDVCSSLTIVPAMLPEARQSLPYAVTLTAAGGTPPYTFVLTGGTLPGGVSLSSSGDLAGVPSGAGTFAFTVGVTDGRGCDGSANLALSVRVAVSHLIGEGLGPSNGNRVRLYSEAGILGPEFVAYGAGAWGTNVGAAQVRSGLADAILTGPGPGDVYGPQVRAFDETGGPLAKINYYAYGTLKFGVGVGAGDSDGDGWEEIGSAAGPGSVFGPHVRGWNYDDDRVGAIAGINYFAFSTLKFGVELAEGDVDGDGFAELLNAPGPGAIFGPQVRGFDHDGTPVVPIGAINFVAHSSLGYGARVSSGDVDGDRFHEIATSPGPGPSHPAEFRGFDVDGGAPSGLPGFSVIGFQGPGYGGRLGLADVAPDGRADLLTAAGPDPSADSSITGFEYDGTTLLPRPVSFEAFPGDAFGANPTGGELGI